MPFDPTNFKMPDNVTVLPPVTPPEEPGREPRQVRIEIEIVDRRQQSPNPRPSRIGYVVFWLFILLMVAQAFGAEPPKKDWWQDTYSYRDSIGTRWTFGADQQGGGHGCTTIKGGDNIDRTSCW